MKDFPQLNQNIYLDCAGSLPTPKPILDQYYQFMSETLLGNPHSLNQSSIFTSKKIQHARTLLLKHLNTNEEEYSVVFGSGTTHALQSVAQSFPWKQITILNRCHTSVIGMASTIATLNQKSVPDVLVVVDMSDIENLPFVQEMNLFVYPAQCNFSGARYPLEWISQIQAKGYHVLLDTASYLSTTPFDVSIYKPDFLVVSFYKIFGFPTGIGALVMKHNVQTLMKRCYFGGGTVASIGLNPYFCSLKNNLFDRMEDGTLPFQQIVALEFGYEYIRNRFSSWSLLSKYTMHLADTCRLRMNSLKHSNGVALIQLLQESNLLHGPIISFLIQDMNQKTIGYTDVMTIATLNGFHIRSGRFCNIGAAQSFLGLDSNQIQHLYQKYGHVCGDSNDILDGKPTGAVRISFGFCNQMDHVDKWISFLETYFIMSLRNPLPKVKIENTIVVLKRWIYPIKSCFGFEVGFDWPLCSTGLLYDRHFMILDSNQHVLNQKKYPKLNCVKIVAIDRKLYTMTIEAPGMESITVSLLKQGECIDSSICTSQVHGVGETGLDEWFSTYLETTCMVIRNLDNHISTRPNRSFVNKAQYLLVSFSSVEKIKSLVPISNQKHITVTNFRSNFLVDFPIPFQENDLIGENIVLDGNMYHIDQLCERCQMICVDDDGNKHAEPLLTLAKQRVNGKIVFGVYLSKC